jgi:hypothetical protein
MANEKQIEELKQKVSEVVSNKFGGDWYKAFTQYAAKNGSATVVDKEDLKALLADADVGSWMTRGAWADGIMKELDKGGDAVPQGKK